MNQGIDQLLAAFERQFGLRCCIIDHHGTLHREGLTVLGQRWQSHRSAAVCRVGFGPRCIEHCRWQINHRLAADPQPIVTRCWKGLREIAVPLRWQGHHLGTFYVGSWRQASRPQAARELPKGWLDDWQALPVWHDGNGDELIAVVQVFAEGLAARLGAVVVEAGQPSDRRLAIEAFVRLHAHLPITIADLADHLQLSTSRCSALVRACCDRPFALLVRARRMQQARHLLVTSTMPVAAVAAAVGYEDPLYFSRCFRAEWGCSPRAFRRGSAVSQDRSGSAASGRP